ncbi:MAG: lysylphosphatidylglycerol synthase transmembrane domain-containing protein [Anaerolineales bacterium]
MRKNWQLLFGIGISLLALALIVRGVRWDELAYVLRTANYIWLLPGAILLTISLWGRGMRWRVFLEDKVSPTRMFWITNIGYLISNVLPFRLGELGRIYLVSRDERVSSMQALSTAILERLIDVLMVFGFIAAILPFVPNHSLIVTFGAGAAAIAAFGVVGLFVAAIWRDRMLAITAAVLNRVRGSLTRPVTERLGSFLDSIRATGGSRMVSGLGWSLFLWVVSGLASYMVLLLFDAQTPWYIGIFVTCSIVLGLALPSSPSGVGVFEAAAVAALTLFGIGAETALAYGVILHLLNFVLIGIYGLIGLSREDESLRAVADSTRTFMRGLRKQASV